MYVEKVFVICLCFFSAAHGVKTGNRCVEDLRNSFTLPLQCHAGERIHVVQELYGASDATTCRLKSAESCSKLASSQSGLVVKCNGKQSCREVVQVQTINNCNITKAVAEVKYNCIKASMNMCSPVTTTVNGSVYLHSPGFPDSVGVNSSCVVQIILLEERIQSGMLKISGDGRQLWKNANMDHYNRVLSGPLAQTAIVYDNHDQDRSYLWIKVVGNSGDVVTALSVVCGILVLSIVVLVIYFMVVKPYRKKHDTSSNTGTSVGHGEPNVYDGIQRYTSDAGDEHNYGHITSSEGPFYANSVNGDGPYINT